MTDTPNPATVAVNRIAWSIQQRAQAQGWKGKKADAYAIEAACGALAASIAINDANKENGTPTHDDQHPITNAISFFAFMVSTRGMDYVRERAARHQQQKQEA